MLSETGAVYTEQKLSKNRNAACVGRLFGYRGRFSLHAGRKINLPGARGNHRTGFRRRKRKTWVAIYHLTGQSQSNDAGFAYFRLHESQKAGSLEVERPQVQAQIRFFLSLFLIICSQFDYSHEKRRLGLNPKRRFVYRLSGYCFLAISRFPLNT